ncbi:flagellar basal body rod protein FlgB [Fibrobacterota bacterium]
MIIKQAIYRHTAMPVIEKSLDAGALRNRTIANNLANVTTPKYRRIEVEFENQLKKVLEKRNLKGARTDPAHLPVGRRELTEISPRAFRAKDPTKPGEINNVDIDIEMAKLAENQLNYQYAVKFMKGQTEILAATLKRKLGKF